MFKREVSMDDDNGFLMMTAPEPCKCPVGQVDFQTLETLSDENLLSQIRPLVQRGCRQNAQCIRFTLWKKYFLLICSVAWKYEKAANLAGLEVSDLIQSGWLKFSKAIDRYKPGPAKLGTWAYKVLSRFFYAEIGRTIESNQRTDYIENIDGFLGNSLWPDRPAELRWLIQDVRNIVESLLPNDKKRDIKIVVFKQHYLHGIELDLLSSVHNLSIHTVRRYTAQVLKAFKKKFMACFPDYRTQNDKEAYDAQESPKRRKAPYARQKACFQHGQRFTKSSG